nr:metallopeptidase TldD-related protein [Streptomyces sp. SID14478]
MTERASEALALAQHISQAARAAETTHTYLDRQAHRQLTVDTTGAKRLRVDDGGFGGYIRLEQRGREVHLSAPDMNHDSAERLLHAGRFHCALTPAIAAERRDGKATAGGWENTSKRLDLSATVHDTDAMLRGLGDSLGADGTVGQLAITDILHEAVFAESGRDPSWSRNYGVEVGATAHSADTSRGITLTRYASTLDAIDLDGLGRELRLRLAATAGATRTWAPATATFTPTASAQILRNLVSTLLLNPLPPHVDMHAALVDEGRAPDAYHAQAFDCEGVATGRRELVSATGKQNHIATRLEHSSENMHEAPNCATGHARWDRTKNFPQMSATNVSLTANSDESDLLAGERHVVVDARSLGVEENRSGGHIAFRLMTVRAVDGRPVEPLAPITLNGTVGDFLAAIRHVGPTVTHYPGMFSVAGAYLEMYLPTVGGEGGMFDDIR